MPYDRFIKLQLAADLMPTAKRDDMRALGYVGAAPIYHHDLRLSGDIIGGFLTDDWDERIDAVSRGVLGISMGCARCHDHKFDPVTQKDYYALMGVFASTVRVERPTFPVDPKIEQQYMWLQRQLFDLAYSVNLLGNEGTTFTNGAEKAVKWKAQMESLKAQATTDLAKYPQLITEPRKVLDAAASRWPAAAGRPGAGRTSACGRSGNRPRRRSRWPWPWRRTRCSCSGGCDTTCGKSACGARRKCSGRSCCSRGSGRPRPWRRIHRAVHERRVRGGAVCRCVGSEVHLHYV